jgi:hypothetical protein
MHEPCPTPRRTVDIILPCEELIRAAPFAPQMSVSAFASRAGFTAAEIMAA